MKSDLLKMTLDRRVPQHEQIREHIRGLIVSGELVPGQRMPSTQQLATRWGATVLTVHTALVPLVKEGLLTRVNRVGTFVAKPEPKLTRAGVYYSSNAWRKPVFAFSGAVHAELNELLRHHGIEMDVWCDPRPESQQHLPWEEIVKAVQRREIQALIVPGSDDEHWDWLRKLPIPSALLASWGGPNIVTSDYAQQVDLSLRHLAQQGCRTVGLISVARKPVIDLFRESASNLQLEVRESWIHTPGEQRLSGEAFEEFGYRETRDLCRQPERPDGLVVQEDFVSRGVISAILEAGVRVPQQMRLVLYRNVGLGYHCPFPVSFVDASPKAYALALIEQIQRQVRDEPVQPISVGFKISQRIA